MIHLTSPPLARLATILLATFAFSACHSDLSNQNPADGAAVDAPPSRIPSATIAPGAPLSFLVDGVGTAAVAWSALGEANARDADGSIDSTGVFRATRAGRYLIMAARGDAHALAYVTVTEDASGAGAAAAPVTLSFAAPRTASLDKRLNLSLSDFWIESSPDSVVLAPGGSAQLSVIGRSADGARWSIRPDWTATGGTVTDSGRYTAPATAGVHRVVATRQGDIQTDTTVVVVGDGAGRSDSVGAPAPTPGSSPSAPLPAPTSVTTACTNEPAGYRRVIDAPWNMLPVRQPEVSSEGFTYFNEQIPTLSIVQDPTAPASAPSIVEMRYPQGFVGGFGPSKFATGNLRPNAGNLYVCFWFKVSPNWTTMGHSITKFFYAKQEGSGLAHAVIAHGQDDHMYLKTLLQYPDDRLNHNLGESFVPANDIGGGGWHKVEVLWEANTPGERNGGFRQWVDGQLTGSDQTAYWFLGGLQPYWDSLWFEPTFGTPYNIVPADQSWYLDQMVVSVK